MKCGAMKLPSGASLDFKGPTLVMAVVNCNEDSFYAPSRALLDNAVEKALVAEEEGASIVDFGGESTRPGSSYISGEEELERVIPVIRAFRRRSTLPVSVDTRKAAVARAALDAGADIINDISALSHDSRMAEVCAGAGAAVVLAHMKGNPLTMQQGRIFYADPVAEVGSYLKAAAERAMAAGIKRDRIIIDPGFGFGKRFNDNLAILRGLARLAEICGNDYPVLVGLSRKSFVGELTGRDTAPERLAGTLAANAAAIMGGAAIIRVHDAGEHADLVKALFALRP